MDSNVTQRNYESVITAIEGFKEAYESYDNDMVKVVNLICEDAVSKGDSWLRNTMAPKLRELLLYSRFQIYKTLHDMYDYFVGRYRSICSKMEVTPRVFALEFKQFTDFALTEGVGDIGVKSTIEVAEYCEQAADMVQKGYQDLEDAYGQYRAVYNSVEDGLIVEDADNADEWNRQFEETVSQLKDPTDSTTDVLKDTADRFREN